MDKEEREVGAGFDLETASLEGLLSALFEIRGYRAAAILTSAGEVLYDTTPADTAKNFGAWMEVFNDLFAHTCHLSESSGFLACQQVAMRTGDEIVVIRSSGQECLVGVRLLVILDHQGNEALVHRKLDQLLPPIIRHLTWDPDNLASLYLKDLPGKSGKPAASPVC